MGAVIPHEIRAGVEALVAANNHRTKWKGHWHTEALGGYLCRFERTAEGWKFYDCEKKQRFTRDEQRDMLADVYKEIKEEDASKRLSASLIRREKFGRDEDGWPRE